MASAIEVETEPFLLFKNSLFGSFSVSHIKCLIDVLVDLETL